MKNSLKNNSMINKYCKNKSNIPNLRWQLFSLIVFILFTQFVAAGPHPNMYLNQEEIDGIKAEIAAEQEPWFSAYNQVMASADVLLNAPVDPEEPYLSVTYQGRTSNLYYTESPYCGWTEVDGLPPDCRSGQINPNQDRGDYNAAIALGDAVRDLGLAYAFTGDADYAEKAINYIRVWTIDSATRMIPDSAWKVEIYITIPGMFYGADLIWNYGGWDPAEKEAFRVWTKAISEKAKTEQISAINAANGTSTGLNNFANWRNVLIGSGGALLDDDGLLDYMESAWKHLISVQMSAAGSSRPGYLGQEVTRERGLHYTLYAINGMTQGAEIMRHRGVNLYDYVGPGGRSLQLALGFVSPFAMETCVPGSTEFCTWRTVYGRKQITEITQNDSMAMYELAYSYYQSPEYLEIINFWGRPMDEIRIMGINTLTHANLFDLNLEPIPPSITTQPESISVIEGEDASFSVQAIGNNPLSYQWFLGGDEISGATNSTYTVEQVSAIDDGSEYYCRVDNDLGQTFSDNATLTVVMDTLAPSINGVVVQSLGQVDITFSEAVTLASAELATNYQISDAVQVISATLNANNRTVHLQIDNLVADFIYTLTVNNIQDISFNANEILPDSSVPILFEPSMGFDNGLLPFGWTPLTASRWSVVEDDGNNALFLNTTAYDPLSGLRLGEHIISPDSYADFTLKALAKTNESSGNANADYALVFGFENGENYFYMLFNRTQNNTQLFKVVGGTRQEIATATANWLTDDEYHTVEVNRVADNIEVKFDGNVVLQVIDGSFPVGRLGLGSYNDSSYFDDIRIIGNNNTLNDLIFLSTFE